MLTLLTCGDFGFGVKRAGGPFDDGARSRVTIELDFEGHGIGKLGVASLSDRVSRERIHDYFLQAAARSRRPITGWNT